MDKHFNLQLFEDGGEGGSGAGQGGNAGTGNGGQGNAGNNGSHGSYSFEQAEEIANARAERAEKSALASYFKQQGMSEDEITEAIKDFKDKRDKQKPNTTTLTQERDEARAELAKIKNTQALQKKGVREDDLDYVTFKVQALMKEDDKLDFEKAAAKFLKENPRYASSGGTGYRVRTGTDGSGAGTSGSGKTGNASINDAIRRAARR